MTDAAQVEAALDRLRIAADHVREGWLPDQWAVTAAGSPPVELIMTRRRLQEQPYGVLRDLVLGADALVALAAELDVPSEVAGVDVAGDALELTVNSLYPITVSVDGRVVLQAGGVPAAVGPALVELGAAGAVERLTLTVRTPPNQVFSIDPDFVPPWIWLHVTTPRLRARFERLDLTWARLHLAHHVASDPAERALVDAAAELVPMDVLTASDDDLSAVDAALEPLAERVSALHVHLVGHSHIDLAWLWTWTDTQDVVERDLVTVLELMDEFPEMCFTHSQPVTYEVLRARRPGRFERVRELVTEGRWEPATAQWVESDTNLVGGEAQARQLLEGVEWTREHLGRAPDVLLAPDTFGHAASMPKLAAAAGVRTYYHHRCIPCSDDGDWPAYWWEGDDGTRILGVTTPAYFGHVTAHEVARAATRAHAAGHATALHLYGVCDHGGGPTRQSLEAQRRFRQEPGLPTLSCSTIAAYAGALLAEGAALPVHRGESSLTFPGCYTSHGDSKTMNRHAEAALTTADTLAALAGHDRGVDREAWRTALFQQFHDILDGSSIGDVYDDQEAAMGAVLAAAAATVASSLTVLHDGVPRGHVAVTNPHGWERTEAVEVPLDAHAVSVGTDVVMRIADETSVRAQVVDAPAGPAVRFLATVPAFGTTTFAFARGAISGGALVDETDEEVTIVTGRYRASVCRSTGEVLHLQRPDGSPLVHAGTVLNVVELANEAPAPMAAWLLGAPRGEERLTAARVAVVEAGPVVVTVAVERRIGTSVMQQELRFSDGIDRIDVVSTIDWQEPGDARRGIRGLRVGCRLGAAVDDAWFEAPFAAVRRPADGREAPGLGWAAVEDEDGRGMALLNDGRHGYSATSYGLWLRLLRSAYEPDPVADIGSHEVRHAFVPFVGGWRSARLAAEVLGALSPLVARPGGTRCSGETPRVHPRVRTGGGVLVTGLRPVGGGAIEIRAYDATGTGGTVELDDLAHGTTVARTSLVGDPLGEVGVVDGRAQIELAPCELVTLLVDPG